MLGRIINKIDTFCLVIVAFFAGLVALHNRRPHVRVTVQAITVPTDVPIGDVELPADDPMNDDDPHGKAIAGLEHAERAEEDEVTARAEGVSVEKLAWAPVAPRRELWFKRRPAR